MGWAIAQEIALLGANVFLMARNVEKLKENCNLLDTSKGQQHGFVLADFSKTENVKTAIEDFIKEKNISILVNNTGGPPAGLIENAKPEDFLSALNLHLINNHTLATAILPNMKSQKFGRIINIISTSVKIPLHNLG
ncbi:MAG: SDR family NAD(P)-dependent oxidoreductase, partial [Chitinophagaceae bacterium]|nr:SDR family NAD(P)-dependent oxidoreductase [Chitinophagaceae bacterium]